MKILMLTPYLPYPPASGGQIRTLNLLKYLNKKHDITLVSLYKNNKEKQYASELKSYCKKIYECKRAEKPWQPGIITQALLTAEPLLIVRNFSVEAKHLLESLLEKETFDVIHAETFYVMPHIPPTDVPVLLVEQTIEYLVYQHFVDNLPFLVRPFFKPDIMKLRYWEKFYWKKASVVATVSEQDQRTIQEIEPTIKPVIISNGAGDEMFVDTLERKETDNPIFLFQGNFFWLQNKEAATYLIKNLYPLLKKILPRFTLIIAGQETKRLNLTASENIKIVEIQPDDSDTVKKIYRQATLFIAPIFGPGGTRLKILAAMASGLPVVATKIGVEGLEVEDTEHVLIANTPDEFISKIQVALNQKELYSKMRRNAYKLAKDRFSWESISQQLEVVYRSMKEHTIESVQKQ